MKHTILPAMPTLLILLITGTATAQSLDLVRDGCPCAEIVVARDAHNGIQAAARDLQEFLEQISGALMSIVNEPGSGVVVYRFPELGTRLSSGARRSSMDALS